MSTSVGSEAERCFCPTVRFINEATPTIPEEDAVGIDGVHIQELFPAHRLLFFTSKPYDRSTTKIAPMNGAEHGGLLDMKVMLMER